MAYELLLRHLTGVAFTQEKKLSNDNVGDFEHHLLAYCGTPTARRHQILDFFYSKLVSL
jgi:hypothetical protein